MHTHARARMQPPPTHTRRWVEHYGDGSFQHLCLQTEVAAGLMPRELWLQFNAVFDYLPLAAVSASSCCSISRITL